MSVEGFYKVRFADYANPNQTRNGGVVVLETQRIFGGDSSYYYRGSYQLKGELFSGDLEIKKHSDGLNSALGPQFEDSANAKIDAIHDEQTIVGTINVPTGLKLPFKLEKIAELP